MSRAEEINEMTQFELLGLIEEIRELVRGADSLEQLQESIFDLIEDIEDSTDTWHNRFDV